MGGNENFLFVKISQFFIKKEIKKISLQKKFTVYFMKIENIIKYHLYYFMPKKIILKGLNFAKKY